MTLYLILFCVTLLVSGVALRVAITLAHRHGIVDRPGGHKTHTHSTPFVGGVAILAALACALFILVDLGLVGVQQAAALGVSGLILFLTGFADDLWHLGFKPRLFIQAGVAMIMVYWGGVHLHDLGQLLSGSELTLGWIAVPFTVFATVGVINALNMIDGIDGLSGSVSFASALLIAMVAFLASEQAILVLALMLMAGLTAFLFFNLRYPTNPRARTFLGDNGSMLIGLIIAWLLIDLSQGEQSAIPPIVAVWLFAVPLMDTVGIMVRRLWLGRSPFRPDRHHIHHLFLRAGFRVEETVHTIALLHLAIGLAGLLLYQKGVPEPVLLFAFLVLFAAYFYTVLRPWRLVPVLRRLHAMLGLPSSKASGLFVGHFPLDKANCIVEELAELLEGRVDHTLEIYRCAGVSPVATAYAIVHFQDGDAEMRATQALRWLRPLRIRLGHYKGVTVRQFIERQAENDRRAALHPTQSDQRRQDRRGRQAAMVIRDLPSVPCTQAIVT